MAIVVKRNVALKALEVHQLFAPTSAKVTGLEYLNTLKCFTRMFSCPVVTGVVLDTECHTINGRCVKNTFDWSNDLLL